MLAVQVPQPQRAVIAGAQEVVVLGVDHQVGDGVPVPLEHLDHPILMDRPIQDQIVLLGRD